MLFLKTFDIYSGSKTNYEDYMPHKYYEGEFINDGYVQAYGDGPAPVYDNYIGENVYLNIINQATKYIYITTPYLIVDYTLMTALETAAKRGVDVRIMTPGIPDKKIVYYLTRDSYNQLIKAGVKIYEYTPGFIHAKSYIADDELGIIGTMNLDYRSLDHNFENGVWIYNDPVIIDMKQDFLETINNSNEMIFQKPKHRLITKFMYILVKIFSPLL